MKKVHLDVNELLEECRIKGYFDVSEISYAILEVNGEISILPKSRYKTINCDDMNIKVPKEKFLVNVIIDGNIMNENLKFYNKDENWLKHQLSVNGYNDINKIILCTLDTDEKINVFIENSIQTFDSI